MTSWPAESFITRSNVATRDGRHGKGVTRVYRLDWRKMVLSERAKIVASQEQVSCKLDSEAAILDLRSGVYYGLDPVGGRV